MAPRSRGVLLLVLPLALGAARVQAATHTLPIGTVLPVTFETTVLGAALSAFVGMWVRNKLPMPYHPVFNVPAFARASSDRFFLCIEATDPRFDRHATATFLESLHPVGVSEVVP